MELEEIGRVDVARVEAVTVGELGGAEVVTGSASPSTAPLTSGESGSTALSLC